MVFSSRGPRWLYLEAAQSLNADYYDWSSLSLSVFLLLLSPRFPFIFLYSSFPSYITSFILLLLSALFFPLLLTPVSSVFIIFTPSVLLSSFFCFNTLLLSSPLFPSFPLWSSSFPSLWYLSLMKSEPPLLCVHHPPENWNWLDHLMSMYVWILWASSQATLRAVQSTTTTTT